MRRKVIAGNWKMNGTIAETEALVSALLSKTTPEARPTIVVCPPFTALYRANQLLSGTHILLGGQEMSAEPRGAFTGDISAELLLTVGATYVILGHSERRQYHAESDQQINVKAKVALASGLIPIICVGETLAQREADLTENVIGTQIDGTLAAFSSAMIAQSIVAYEPVWAIGTGRTATPDMAQDVHRFIRNRISALDPAAADAVRILYGGSVKADNAEGLLNRPDIDGALVGGASLKADEFVAIINAA
jgi:triosephosphate isomerase (TIM)